MKYPHITWQQDTRLILHYFMLIMLQISLILFFSFWLYRFILMITNIIIRTDRLLHQTQREQIQPKDYFMSWVSLAETYPSLQAFLFVIQNLKIITGESLPLSNTTQSFHWGGNRWNSGKMDYIHVKMIFSLNIYNFSSSFGQEKCKKEHKSLSVYIPTWKYLSCLKEKTENK